MLRFDLTPDREAGKQNKRLASQENVRIEARLKTATGILNYIL
jgi:hypothetical protein